MSIEYLDLGRADYQPTWDLQKAIQGQLIEDKKKARNHPELPVFNDALLFVEHPHVYTLGKSGDAANLLADSASLAKHSATFVKIDRGGDITYHGPGQLVAYPILDLDRYFTDIHRYLRTLEEIIIKVCESFGLAAGRIEGLTGVWIEDRKICAMGVKCSRWVTMHGLAFNVSTKLDYFNHIIPCGINDKAVTSLEKELSTSVDRNEVIERFIKYFAKAFKEDLTQASELERFVNKFPYFQHLANISTEN